MINNVVLVGRLTKEPELKHTNNDTPVSNVTLAVNRPFSNGNGERDADFINCVVWKKSAESLVKYMSKGSLIGIEGRLQTRTYDDNGKTVYVTEVIAERVQFLESRSSSNQGNTPNNNQGNRGNFHNNRQGNQGNYQNKQHQNNYQSNGSNQFEGHGFQVDVSDEEFPF